MAQDTSLREAKVAQGRPKYLRGGQLPPASLLPAPMQYGVLDTQPSSGGSQRGLGEPSTLRKFKLFQKLTQL